MTTGSDTSVAAARVVGEPAREVPVVREADVIVCGGGPAGVAAAVSAGRSGARTCLIENHGCLGGVWTAGLLTWILDWDNKPGFMSELVGRLDAFGGARRGGPSDLAFDPETMKLVLEQVCREAGVHVRLHTRVVGAMVEPDADGERSITAVLTESKTGREAWRARCYVDATGDGDLAARAGCDFAFGREIDGQAQWQPMTLMALVAGLDTSTPAVSRCIHADSRRHREATSALLDQLRAVGFEPSYTAPCLFPVHDGLFALMANHQYGYSGLEADDLTAATLAARGEMHALVAALRRAGGGWSQLRMVSTASQVGVREGRRVRGRYQVSVDDLRHGVRHDDAVCRVTFPVDVHAPRADDGKGYGNEGVRSQAYDIPLRALIAADVGNLLLAGRCISGDFLAHSSYRVTGNAVAMGQAAGMAAAVAVEHRVRPHELDYLSQVRPRIEQVNQDVVRPLEGGVADG